MNWFDPSDQVVIRPEVDRTRLWKRKFGSACIDIAPQVLYVNNSHGDLFAAVCRAFYPSAAVVNDFSAQGYCHFQFDPAGQVTVYQAPDTAPYAAADLEFLISSGARQIVFLNGAGSLDPRIRLGSLLLPGELIREEGTSFHYAAEDVRLNTNNRLNKRILRVAKELHIRLFCGKNWTTDAIYRTSINKVRKHRRASAISVEMELSALTGVAHYRKCALSAVLIVTDMVVKNHTWSGTQSRKYSDGVRQMAQLAARIFPCTLENI